MDFLLGTPSNDLEVVFLILNFEQEPQHKKAGTHIWVLPLTTIHDYLTSLFCFFLEEDLEIPVSDVVVPCPST